MKRILFGLGTALVLLGSTAPVWAHGITVVLERRGDVVLATCTYDGGIPVRGADVVVVGPGDAAPYQNGSTDREGRFAFVPSGPGEWQVTVDDGAGHRRTVRIAMESAAATADDGAAPGLGAVAGGPVSSAAGAAGDTGDGEVDPVHADGAADGQAVVHGNDGTRLWRLATGLSLLFGLTGFGYGYSARARVRTGGA